MTATIKQNRLKARITTTMEIYSWDEIDPYTIDESGDPAVDIPRKVSALADMLGCDEKEAQRILFAHGAALE